jgi:ABC-2 type transport system ATP-binding protein
MIELHDVTKRYGPTVAGTAGITLYELSTQSASLEHAFMELTRDASEYHASGHTATALEGAAA